MPLWRVSAHRRFEWQAEGGLLPEEFAGGRISASQLNPPSRRRRSMDGVLWPGPPVRQVASATRVETVNAPRTSPTPRSLDRPRRPAGRSGYRDPRTEHRGRARLPEAPGPEGGVAGVRQFHLPRSNRITAITTIAFPIKCRMTRIWTPLMRTQSGMTWGLRRIKRKGQTEKGNRSRPGEQ